MTMKEKLNKLLTTKQEQRDNLNAALIECDSKEQRAAMGETLSKLADEIRDIEEMLKDIDKPAEDDKPAEGEPAAASADNTNTNERGMNIMATMDTNKQNTNEQTEARAKQLHEGGKMTIGNAEARDVLVSSGKLATPTEVAGINDILGARVSSIVDMVKIVDAEGMGAYKVAYQKTDAEAATTAEGAAYHAGEPTFDYVEIKPQTETVLSYISKQARKQTPLKYADKVNESALVALRRRAAAIITEKTLDSELVERIDVNLDETALRKIAFSYGGDESIVGAAVLQLNKADLVTLGDVRGSADLKPVYEITPDSSNPNTGIIKDGGLSVHYVINSNLPDGKLVYGQMHNFELALFSDYEINVSSDFAFDKGLLTISGDVELGGDVTVQGGFVIATYAMSE